MAVTYEPIATTTLGSATSTISFTSITSSYTDLVLRVSGSVTGGDANINVTLNGASSNMGWGRLRQSTRGGAVSYINSSSSASFMNVGFVSASDPFVAIVDINAYTSTDTYKQIICKSFSVNRNNFGIGGWMSYSAVNRVDFITSENMTAGTTATLFGILRA
jgi:hypothetical protein